MLIYVCSPLKATETRTMAQHLVDAHEYCVYVLRQGYFPLAPHTILTRYLDDTKAEDRNLGRSLGLAVIPHCSEVWVFGENMSEGMQDEITHAEHLCIPIRYVPTSMLIGAGTGG